MTRKEFFHECEIISAECEAEGYPSTGYNYDMRVDALLEWLGIDHPDELPE